MLQLKVMHTISEFILRSVIYYNVLVLPRIISLKTLDPSLKNIFFFYASDGVLRLQEWQLMALFCIQDVLSACLLSIVQARSQPYCQVLSAETVKKRFALQKGRLMNLFFAK